jgi:hypothetical protein
MREIREWISDARGPEAARHQGANSLSWSACCEVTARSRLVAVGVDLGGIPLLPDDAGGSAPFHSPRSLLGAKLPRVKQEYGLDAPGPGSAPGKTPPLTVAR